VQAPLAGETFPLSSDAPPEFSKELCANQVIHCKEVNATLSDAPTTTVVQAWVYPLERMDDRYVEINEHSRQIFDF
jgi:hypothetical protein